MIKAALVAAAILSVTAASAYSAEWGIRGPGASEYSPGDTMKDKGGTASQYSPGHQQKSPGGASERSPGDRMNDQR